MLARVFALVLLALSVGCNDTPPSDTPPVANCVDNDHDGFDSCADCNDADEAVHPGAPEKCDGVDNDCNNKVDEGCAAPGPDAGQPGPDAGTSSCTGTQTRACGKAGSSCIETCTGGTYGVCQLPTGPVDTQNDPANCGQCGNACPTPAGASPRCVSGQCGRGPCAPGKFDLDGVAANGCEASCTGRTCTDGSGNTVTLSAPPLHEGALGGVSAGAAFAGSVQTGGSYTNTGVVGDSSPAAPGAVQKSGSYSNVGGLNGLQK